MSPGTPIRPVAPRVAKLGPTRRTSAPIQKRVKTPTPKARAVTRKPKSEVPLSPRSLAFHAIKKYVKASAQMRQNRKGVV